MPGITPISGKTEPGVVDGMVGIYLAAFDGSLGGHALMEVRLGDGDGRLRVTTIDGFGFTVRVTNSGRIEVTGMQNELAGATGEGVKVSDDSFVFTATVAGSGVFPDGAISVEASRVVGTDTTFPLSVVPMNTTVLLPATITRRVTSLDPVSGLQTTVATGQVTITTFNNNSAEFDVPLGGRFTAAFHEPLRAVSRVVGGATGEYATIAGSAVSGNRDVLGRFDFSDVNNFTAVLAVQSRDPLGQQTQEIITVGAP
jgi:hypothetical protein